MQSETLEGLVPIAPLSLFQVRGLKRHQPMGSHTVHQPVLLHDGDAFDAGIHELRGAQGLVRDESKDWVSSTSAQ